MLLSDLHGGTVLGTVRGTTMREIACPHCLNVNRVAGMFEGGTAEGEVQTILYCAFCGQTFTPVELPRKDGQEAAEYAHSEV
jgi:hypothetical protein